MKSLRAGIHQVAALPLRLGSPGGELEVLLLTSRETRRWVIPKGWPVKGLKDWEAAAEEAREEAGIEGDVGQNALGSFTYFKRLDGHFRLLDVAVYPLWVESRASKWKEKGQRDEIWTSVARATQLVDEPGLQSILNQLSQFSARTRTPAV